MVLKLAIVPMHKYVAGLAEKSEGVKAMIVICTILFYLVNGASMVLRHSSASSLGSNCCIYLQKIKNSLWFGVCGIAKNLSRYIVKVICW